MLHTILRSVVSIDLKFSSSLEFHIILEYIIGDSWIKLVNFLISSKIRIWNLRIRLSNSKIARVISRNINSNRFLGSIGGMNRWHCCRASVVHRVNHTLNNRLNLTYLGSIIKPEATYILILVHGTTCLTDQLGCLIYLFILDRKICYINLNMLLVLLYLIWCRYIRLSSQNLIILYL